MEGGWPHWDGEWGHSSVLLLFKVEVQVEGGWPHWEWEWGRHGGSVPH